MESHSLRSSPSIPSMREHHIKIHKRLFKMDEKIIGGDIPYIFFGIHTANVVHLAERLAEQQKTKAA